MTCTNLATDEFQKIYKTRQWPEPGNTTSEYAYGVAAGRVRYIVLAKSALWNFLSQTKADRSRAMAWIRAACSADLSTDQIYQAARDIAEKCYDTVAEGAEQCLGDGAAAIAQEAALNRYREEFARSSTAADFASFIAKYADNDPERLIPRAEKLRDEKLAVEAEKERRRKDDEQRLAKARQAKLEAWRKSIRIGDETFCGPVIEVRQPMIKISIKVLLPGYPSEAWLKLNAVYPDWMANCQNIDGHLSPVF